MYQIKEKNCDNLSTVNWIFFIILEIVQYAIFMKLIAINGNEIFHVKGKEFFSTINIYSRWELVEFLSRTCILIIHYTERILWQFLPHLVW